MSLLPVADDFGKEIVEGLGCWEDVDGKLVIFVTAIDVVVEVDGKDATAAVG